MDAPFGVVMGCDGLFEGQLFDQLEMLFCAFVRSVQEAWQQVSILWLPPTRRGVFSTKGEEPSAPVALAICSTFNNVDVFRN